MDTSSMIRTILLVLALVNQALVMGGNSPLPFSNQELELGISTILTTVMSIWTWWKNNYLSKRGMEQKEVLKEKGLYKP